MSLREVVQSPNEKRNTQHSPEKYQMRSSGSRIRGGGVTQARANFIELLSAYTFSMLILSTKLGFKQSKILCLPE